MKYIYIKSKNHLEDKTPLILEAVSEALTILKYENDKNTLTIYYTYTSISIAELTNLIVTELYEDITIYESIIYKDEKKLIESIEIVKELLDKLQNKENYITNRDFLINDLSSENVKKLILSDYYNDKEMYLTIKTYLEQNQNVSKASEYLYLHRNTLNQRLNKFKSTTNFDVKKFIDGFLIYKLIK